MEVLDLSKDPQAVAHNGYDGIWVELKDRATPSPLMGRTLQWLDWKLQGQLSRSLLASKAEDKSPLFVPTMRKIPAQYVVLIQKLDARRLRESCEGLGLKKILFICEERGRAAAVGRELSAKGGGWPQVLDVGIEPNEESA